MIGISEFGTEVVDEISAQIVYFGEVTGALNSGLETVVEGSPIRRVQGGLSRVVGVVNMVVGIVNTVVGVVNTVIGVVNTVVGAVNAVVGFVNSRVGKTRILMCPRGFGVAIDIAVLNKYNRS
jgi:hypothetical protein